jgi:hypothetical protein
MALSMFSKHCEIKSELPIGLGKAFTVSLAPHSGVALWLPSFSIPGFPGTCSFWFGPPFPLYPISCGGISDEKKVLFDGLGPSLFGPLYSSFPASRFQAPANLVWKRTKPL